jgi:hypothetical protein
MTVTKIQIVRRLIPREIFDAIVKLDSRSQKIVNFASLLLMNVALEFIIVMKTHFALIKQTVQGSSRKFSKIKCEGIDYAA